VADEKRSDLLGRLADLSEEAMHRLQEAPGGDRVVGTMNAMRDRVDELQRRVRGIDELERRLTALERKVDKLAKDAGPSTARASKTKS
jgi:polyhydroxyalkanoate synthesis regulator phasin